jgi:membrane-associated protease RseP (regulator of RpoE activity)
MQQWIDHAWLERHVVLKGLFIMRSISSLFLALLLAGCTVSEDGPPQLGDDACTADGQKQFVFDAMQNVYFWNLSLPASVDLSAHASAEDLLNFLKTFSPINVSTGLPIDRFSFINSAAADSAFFGEGQFEGFGFSWRYQAVDDVRFTRVFSSSPAANAGFMRGHRIVALAGRTIADIDANEGVSAVFAMDPLEFTIRRLDDTEFTVTVTKDVVTINPLPQWRVIDTPTGSVGYMELATFISTADPVFDTIFSDFRNAGITDLIIDLRYNGGGLVSTTELLGDYLGGFVSQGQVFSETLYNDNNSNFNSTRRFSQRLNSINLSRLVIVGSANTASASELVTNSMEPHVDVTIVGATTFGKPVGQVGILFCEKILRPTAFETVNSLGEGDYFDGLPVDCPAVDDLSVTVGADDDPNVMAALSYFANGACPAGAQQSAVGQEKASLRKLPAPDLRGPAHREFAGAF